MNIQEELVAAATRLASRLNADAILTLTESGRSYELIRRSRFAKSMIKRATGINNKRVKLITATPNQQTYDRLSGYPDVELIKLEVRDPTRMDQIHHAVWRGLRDGLFWAGELVVCLVGDSAFPGGTDTIFVCRIEEPEVRMAEIVETDPLLASVVDITSELRESKNFGNIGTAFVIGNAKEVLRRSRQLIPNPLEGHGKISANDSEDREIIKRYAYLDGAFVVDDEGCVLAAGRYLDVNSKADNLPKGFGTRHRAVAAMTAVTKARGLTLSETDGMIRIFKKGKLVVRLDPKNKMLIKSL